MKIAIGYPPLENIKGVPQISQNRQFQWTGGGNLAYSIYPVIPASAATLLKSKGHQVFWLDGLAEKISYSQWQKQLAEAQPDLLALETKTPVIQLYWRLIADLKKRYPNLKLVLMGDHVTALPLESMDKSPVDFILTGGDYDFLLLNLADHIAKGKQLEPGIWYRSGTTIKNSGKFKLDHDLEALPLIDRELTRWHLYAYKNSNFFRAPGAYTMFGRDCWWGKCTFCSWTTLFPGRCYRRISVSKALSEVDWLVNHCRVKEIMDDSGTFPDGEWLRQFCRGLIKKGYPKRLRFNCNLRFNADLTGQDYQLMGRAGFRFILYGLESASQTTLNKINKNLKVEQIEPVLTWAKQAGLAPHLTIMVGYPWEKAGDLENTMDLAVSLFKKGLADSMQATIVIPYPGTPLYRFCRQKGLLKTTNWQHYDMRQSVIKTSVGERKLLSAVRGLYSRTIWTPRFLVNTLWQLKSWDGIKYVTFQAYKYFGKLREFK